MTGHRLGPELWPRDTGGVRGIEKDSPLSRAPAGRPALEERWREPFWWHDSLRAAPFGRETAHRSGDARRWEASLNCQVMLLASWCSKAGQLRSQTFSTEGTSGELATDFWLKERLERDDEPESDSQQKATSRSLNRSSESRSQRREKKAREEIPGGGEPMTPSCPRGIRSPIYSYERALVVLFGVSNCR
ncbi:hypothetical protein BO71DRAFT_113971 [Aspergillus ellipticus CBS 707.79]|uniref:Uncharacterized protein n=1 Tax=Aspergillus ellipticus CBS 707.79 TaxID=1448320 RepID=A0A319EDJ5_9EURO|nr:hypothetical protein BO71DRAFT_113971 [Aspergillus ellipticus CBS 707.79]